MINSDLILLDEGADERQVVDQWRRSGGLKYSCVLLSQKRCNS